MHSQLQQFYAEKNVLITGGASFIGSHLVDLLLSNGARIRVCDDLSSGRLDNLSKTRDRIEFLEGDLRNKGVAATAAKGVDILFHLAAMHGGRGYIETHPVECVNNMLLDNVVFDSAVAAGVRKIIHASSACVYPTNLQASESELLYLAESDANFEKPGKAFADGEYGWAKLMGELQLRAYVKQHELDGVACRLFTAYGERENESHAAIALIAKAVAKMDPYAIWGNGQQTRNFTYVADTVMGMALAGAKLEGFEVINIGTDEHNTVLDLVEVVFESLGWRPNKIDFQLDMPVGVKSRASDNTRISELLGWKPGISLAQGIGRTTDWYASIATPDRLAMLEEHLMRR